VATRTRSVDPRLSEEVRWFLRTRGIPHPDCPPRFLTPDGSQLPDAMFDPSRVDRVMTALSLLCHTQGKWAGRPLKPDPWQVAYIIAPVFGWVRENDDGDIVRVVRSLYVEEPRKNGKTSLSGGLAIYLTCADDEPGAQVYALAAGKDQARFCFDPIKALAEKSPHLSPYVRPTASRVVHVPTSSYFAVVSALADLLHGANVHGAIIDELHVHKTPDLVEAIESGTGSRRQPLVITITTADDGRQGTIYSRKRERIEQLARGALTDPSVYGVIWAADPEAEGYDPFDERTWAAANPGYGISPTREYLRSAAAEAQQSPAQLAVFLRLHLGIRTKQETKYLDLAAWDANEALVAEAALAGRECFGGLDPASTADLCALCWDFPDGKGGHEAIWRMWVPEAAMQSLDRRTAGQAAVWVRRGWLTTTPGNVADYDHIRQQINRDRTAYRVKEIGYDPWNSSQLVNDLVSDGATMVPVRQGYASMSPPTKALQRLLLEGSEGRPRYRHGPNRCLRWQVDNFAAELDAAGNAKPSKAKAGDKIDGLVAAIIALDRAMRHADKRAAFLGSA
jgi:phage terminase large subunit-like protein